MSRVTRFAAADPGAAARVSGFISHLRDNGFNLGVSETDTALRALCCVNPIDPVEARLALKSVCAGCLEDSRQFDVLFDAFWMAKGRVRHKVIPSAHLTTPQNTRSTRQDNTRQSSGKGAIHTPEDGADMGETDADGTGELMASKAANLMKKDLRELVSKEDIRAAEDVAIRLGKALRDQRSRRRKAARTGRALDMRRTMRLSLSSGGEPLRLARRTRPDRPLKIVALCDVSGSMMHYARPFLAFLAGLMRADDASDAYLFHTRLVRITEPLRDPDPLRALNRITLLADGFGGGSRIGENLAHFARSYARKFVDGRSVVLILSDGYDSDTPTRIDGALAKLKRRGCRIIWLNPLKGWRDYAPVAQGMAAALPHLDDFAAAATLNDLAALEHRLARL
ncbi:vWA domain-containing protein [Roseobacter weihaiensis]|uniref:vWA domain-containing protein n=1 Tax=Roseobacter weihaiensis TaxID=2763262 RepID=UPI001D09EBCC|nr:VWA domain-containing protein [Roseobacter sp. H9]